MMIIPSSMLLVRTTSYCFRNMGWTLFPKPAIPNPKHEALLQAYVFGFRAAARPKALSRESLTPILASMAF